MTARDEAILSAFTAPVGGLHRNIAIKFGMKKTRMLRLPDGEKIEDTFTRFDRIHERDRRTDGQTEKWTPHDDIGRA